MTTPAAHPAHGRDFPRRIVCLTDETTEILYLLGQQHRIVGVSGYARRPAAARSKPRVSAFRDADIPAILALKPDLVLTFSDVQAEITRQLVLRGVTVLNFNQRTLAEILDAVELLARIVGRPAQGRALVRKLLRGLDIIAASAQTFPFRPRVFFEEWNDPLISGIGWVEELLEIAGGQLLFPQLRNCGKAQDRVVDPAAVAVRDPQLILASWCGRKVNLREIASRPGWSDTSAVRNGHAVEIPSTCILQPGPAALTEGLWLLHQALARVAGIDPGPALRRAQKAAPQFL
ncbi:MAG TPA: cobalamin-binding protein [Terracidiphilus sp.]|nr:cobalamin-binding protein [Terracidiphilus sp.]